MVSKRRVVLVSGYFSPIHRAHIEYFKNARELAGPDGLVYAIVNNDAQSVLKKGYSFIPERDRLAVVAAVRYVDRAFLSIDTDRAVCRTIEALCDTLEVPPTIWFNEGDVTDRCPEEAICALYDIQVLYGTGEKVQSSSWILERSVKTAYERMYGSGASGS